MLGGVFPLCEASRVEGSVNVGRSYRVTELLGRGAFGAVYLADTVGAGLPKKVAVKVLNPDRAVSPEMVGAPAR